MFVKTFEIFLCIFCLSLVLFIVWAIETGNETIGCTIKTWYNFDTDVMRSDDCDVTSI